MTMKMNPIGFFADLMTSKYFLLFVALISAINIIGYMSMGYIDAVMLFAMVAYLTFVFSKNMTVVLLVAVIVVNLYMQVVMSREGVDSKRGGTTGAPNQAGSEVGNLEALTNRETLMTKDDAMPDDDAVEMEEPEVETTEETVEQQEEEEEEEPVVKEGISSKTERSGFANKDKVKGASSSRTTKVKGASIKEPAPINRIDYGTTLADAYKNLEKMLGKGGLENMTADTKKLMEQQSQLFNSMENIAPLLAQAQTMMKEMNITGANDVVTKEGFWSGRVGGIADYAEVL